MQELLLVEEVDVRRLDDPDDSRVLTITKMLLPPLKRKTVEHTAGGGVGTVKYVLPMIEAIEPTMSVKGLDRGTLAAFGFIPGQIGAWTMAAALRDTSTNKILPVRATVRGTLAEWNPGEHSPGESLDCDHVFHEVTYYDLFVNNEEWFAWGVRPRIGRSFGVDWFGPYVNALGA